MSTVHFQAFEGTPTLTMGTVQTDQGPVPCITHIGGCKLDGVIIPNRDGTVTLPDSSKIRLF